MITNLFGANYAQMGASVTATSLPWDSVIPPGSAVTSVGFYATYITSPVAITTEVVA